MEEFEERPSKIRRIEPTDNAKEPVISDILRSETPEQTPTEGANPQHKDVEKQQSEGEGQQNEETPRLSKSQLKKLRKAEQWEAGKDYRRAKRREKHKEKQAKKAEARAELEAKINSGEVEIIPPKPEEGRRVRPRRPIQLPVALILDCDFDDLMTEKEIISLGAQITRSYSENRTTSYRSHLTISSWGGSLKKRFESVLTNTHLGWKGVRFFEDNFVSAAEALAEVMRGDYGGKLAGAFRKDDGDSGNIEETKSVPLKVSETGSANETGVEVHTTDSTENGHRIEADAKLASDKPKPSIVYLTADSPHTIETLSPYTSYIIGGIVDKNRHKGICYKRACEYGIPTAKLPIGEYMTMQSRSVLTVNHVVEIMLKWLETGDWGESFLSVIPKRKEAKLKAQKGEEGQEESASEDEQDGGTSNMKDTSDGSENV